MQLKLDDQYCAGLWKKHLITQIYWTTGYDGQNLLPRPEPYRAPSWSWAGLDVPVSLSLSDEDDNAMELVINILDCDVDSSSGDDTCIITSGRLRLSGWLSTIRVCPTAQNEWSVFFNGVWGGKSEGFMVEIDCQLPSDKLHCLPLFVNTHSPLLREENSQTLYWNVACLILCSTGDAKGQFRRFGTLHIFSGAFGIEDWRVFKRSQKEAWFEYESTDDKQNYTMSII